MPASGQASSAFAYLRDRGLRALERAGRHTALLLSFVLLTDVFVALWISLHTALWHDELFTYWISQAPTLRDLMLQIRTIDLNPPLSYLLTRASFHLFGVGTLQCRLPEMLGFLLALASTFFFVRRRAGNSYGVLACAILVATLAGDLTIQARPYGLMLGFTALALVAWQSSSVTETEGGSSWGYDLLLMVSLCLLLLSHVFGLLGWLAIAFAEGVSALQRRRVSVLRALALLAPLAVTLLYVPLLRDHGQSLFPHAFQPHLYTIVSYYGHMLLLGRRAIVLWLAAAVLLLIREQRGLQAGTRPAFAAPEWAAAFALFLLPAALMFRLMLQHAAFFDRYGLLACVGMAVLCAAGLHWSAGGRQATALIAALLVLLISGRLTLAARSALEGHVLRHSEPTLVSLHLEGLPDSTLPIVDASGLTFVEMNHRETPQILSRTWYLTGGDIATQYAHATIFESMALEKQIFHFPSNVDTYGQFTARHRHFYVFGTIDYPEDWLLRKLIADGATVLLQKQVYGAYRDTDIYEVRLRD